MTLSIDTEKFEDIRNISTYSKILNVGGTPLKMDYHILVIQENILAFLRELHLDPL